MTAMTMTMTLTPRVLVVRFGFGFCSTELRAGTGDWDRRMVDGRYVHRGFGPRHSGNWPGGGDVGGRARTATRDKGKGLK